MNARKIVKMSLLGASAIVAPTIDAAVPEVGNVTMVQSSGSREVTITYTVANAPAIVTLDVETNGPNGWVSIGAENINTFSSDSDVWKKVSGKDLYTIKWRPDLSWPDHKIADGGARAVVTAWSLDNPPDYMVVDIGPDATKDTPKRFYTSPGNIPGGLLNGDIYRTTSIVMRKIMAKGVTWKMGSVGETNRRDDETAHTVTLDDNYYIGVFPVTQAQWKLVAIDTYATPSYFNNMGVRWMRPVEQVSYAMVALSETGESFLDRLRAKTGIDFNLPSEAQWEFACRAGNGEGSWGNGSPITSAYTDPNLPGRYRYNGGQVNETDPDANCDATVGTAIVGSYAPNDWGIYDMHGNVNEWCLDWYETSISAYNGAVNISATDPKNTLSGAAGEKRVMRGSSFANAAYGCRSAYRTPAGSPGSRSRYIGCRMACHVRLD